MRRNRPVVLLSTLAFVAIMVGVAGTMVQARKARVQARNAREERDFAFRQLSRTEAINDLNRFLLSDGAPGKPITVNELLGRAEQIVERQRGDNASRVDLLIAIGRQYASLDEDTTARRLLEEAYQLSRGLSEPSPAPKLRVLWGALL